MSSPFLLFAGFLINDVMHVAQNEWPQGKRRGESFSNFGLKTLEQIGHSSNEHCSAFGKAAMRKEEFRKKNIVVSHQTH